MGIASAGSKTPVERIGSFMTTWRENVPNRDPTRVEMEHIVGELLGTDEFRTRMHIDAYYQEERKND